MPSLFGENAYQGFHEKVLKKILLRIFFMMIVVLLIYRKILWPALSGPIYNAYLHYTVV